MGFFNGLTATAVSFVVGGNTGVSPFLSLFLVGVIERCNPNLLNMSGLVEAIVASWPGIFLLGSGTILELVSKCVPVVDEIMDMIMTFVIPVMSVLGSLSTFGLFTMPDFESIQANDDGSGGERKLVVGTSGLLIFFQVMIVIIGIGLALSMHMVKMVVRLIGQGWLTNCLAVVEASWCVITITLAIFIRPIAIFIAVCIFVVGAYNIKRKVFENRKSAQHEPIAEHPVQQQAAARGDVEGGRYKPPQMTTVES